MKLLSLMVIHKDSSTNKATPLKGAYELNSFSYFTKKNAQVKLLNIYDSKI
jgi:hypothetical protein